MLLAEINHVHKLMRGFECLFIPKEDDNLKTTSVPSLRTITIHTIRKHTFLQRAQPSFKLKFSKNNLEERQLCAARSAGLKLEASKQGLGSLITTSYSTRGNTYPN